jgi:polyisoprenoid-binding protein YceI
MKITAVVGAAFSSVVMLASLSLPLTAAEVKDVWDIDSSHSSATLAVRHMMVSNVRGNLGQVQGKVNYDGKNLPGAAITATVDATGIDTHDAKRDEHLRSADFLDTAKFPTISFKSTKLEKTTDGFKMFGDLTMHGVTKPVVLTGESPTEVVKDPYGNYRFGASAKAKLNRKDFGINFDKTLDNGGALVGDEVTVQLDVEMKRKAL